jgi:hypothetical protein
MFPADLRLIRQVHIARLDRAPRYDRHQEPCGAPTNLVRLGCYLASAGVEMQTTGAELWFGWTPRDYAMFPIHAELPGLIDDGRRFAEAILADLRSGGTGMDVRMPSVHAALETAMIRMARAA